MPAEDPPVVNDHVALRKALLAHHNALAAAWRLPLPAARAAMRLDRIRLSWLLAPWGMLSMLISFPRAMRRAKPLERRLVRLYTQASGRDPDVARAEVDRIQAQLMPLDERSTHRLSPGATGSRPADQAELEATAAALLVYYLAGRQTNETLLAEVQAAYTAYEEGLQASTAVMAERGMRAASRADRARRAQDAAALARCLATWRRWIDQAQTGSEPAAARPGPRPGPRPVDRPAGDHAAPREVWTEQLLALLRNDHPADLDRVFDRVRDRLTRLKLTWLTAPVQVVAGCVVTIVSLPRWVRTMMRDEARSLGLYRRLSGADAEVAGAELWRIRRQLLRLDSPPPEDPSLPGASTLASRTNREAVTRALLGYFLAGRPPNDALLAETQAAFATLESLEEREEDLDARGAFGVRGWRRRHAHDAVTQQQVEIAEQRYRQAWRRWLEQQPTDRSL